MHSWFMVSGVMLLMVCSGRLHGGEQRMRQAVAHLPATRSHLRGAQQAAFEPTLAPAWYESSTGTAIGSGHSTWEEVEPRITGDGHGAFSGEYYDDGEMVFGDGFCEGDCSECDACAGGCADLLRRCRNWLRDEASWFNCGCNGSYKFPVPPLYTYHWPGMYQHERMTDYHSPWRFPPLRVYKDESGPGAPAGDDVAQPISYHRVTDRVSRHGVESMSSKMRRRYGD